MAYLYQAIMGVPGLSGSSYDRQKQLYERLGSPMGAYRGTYDQNIWLLGKVNSGQTGGGGGGEQRQESRPSQPSGPSYEDIMRAQQEQARRAAEERQRRGQEQLQIWNSFMNDPNWFDEMLVRSMENDRWNRYYRELLNDFITPLKQRVQQSKDTAAKALEELTRRTQVGAEQSREELQQSLEQAGEGFSGAGLYGSGLAKRALTQKRLSGEESIQDFLARSKAEEEQTKLAQTQKEEELATTSGLKEKEYFGQGRLVEQNVAQNVAQQKNEAQKRQAQRALESIQSKYGGELLLTIPDFLRY